MAGRQSIGCLVRCTFAASSMNRFADFDPACPNCRQSLRGLAPVPPALLLRCPECGHITTVQRIAQRQVHHRRSIAHLLLWTVILMLVLIAFMFRRAVHGLIG